MAGSRDPHAAVVLAGAGILALAGCASTHLDAQWSDPQAANSLHGARVMVACEAYDLVIKQICQDQLAAELVARGATPVIAPDTRNPAPGRPLGAEQYLAAARSAGAKAVLTSYIAPSSASAGPGLMLGIGSFSVGSGGFGAGVGVSAPIGDGQTRTGYSANSRVTDATSGRLLWTARATSPPSNDLQAQLAELTKAVFGAADKAQLF